MSDKTKKSLEELKEKFKGTGNLESESILVDNNSDKKDGYVTVWSNKSDISKIIARCGTDIKDYEVFGDGVMFYINKGAFRGVECAFRNRSNGGKRKFSEEQIQKRSERMKQYWIDKKKTSK